MSPKKRTLCFIHCLLEAAFLGKAKETNAVFLRTILCSVIGYYKASIILIGYTSVDILCTALVNSC